MYVDKSKASKNLSRITLLLYILFLISCFVPVSGFLVILTFFVESFSMIYIFKEKNTRFGNLLVLSIFISLLYVIFPLLLFDVSYFKEIFRIFIAVPYGYYLAKYGFKKKYAYLLFCIIIGVIVFRYLLTGDMGSVFTHASRNAISSYALLCSCFVYTVHVHDKSLPILPALISFLVSALAVGRGGIISSLILLIGVILINTHNKKLFSIKGFLFLVSFIISSFVFFLQYFDLFFKEALDKMDSQSFAENDRIVILNQYLQIIKNNNMKLLFGVPSSDIPLVEYLSGNFHNSYLSLHSHFGIIGFFILFYMLHKSCHKIIMSKSWILLLILITILVRIYTDLLAFNGLYDSLFFYIIFLSISSYKNKNENFIKNKNYYSSN